MKLSLPCISGEHGSNPAQGDYVDLGLLVSTQSHGFCPHNISCDQGLLATYRLDILPYLLSCGFERLHRLILTEVCLSCRWCFCQRLLHFFGPSGAKSKYSMVDLNRLNAYPQGFHEETPST